MSYLRTLTIFAALALAGCATAPDDHLAQLAQWHYQMVACGCSQEAP